MDNTPQRNQNALTVKELKCFAINVNSIITNQRRAALLNFIEKHNPDCLFLSETKLSKAHKPFFENYIMYRDDRSAMAGGTAILIKKNMQSNQNINTINGKL